MGCAADESFTISSVPSECVEVKLPEGAVEAEHDADPDISGSKSRRPEDDKKWAES